MSRRARGGYGSRPPKAVIAVVLAAALALPSITAAAAEYRDSGAKLSDDSWLWSTGDFHPDRGLPDALPFQHDPRGQRDTA